MKKTTLRQNVTDTDRKWFIVDAADKTIGELSTAIANVLRGKHRVDFTPHADNGDYVVVAHPDLIAGRTYSCLQDLADIPWVFENHMTERKSLIENDKNSKWIVCRLCGSNILKPDTAGLVDKKVEYFIKQ